MYDEDEVQSAVIIISLTFFCSIVMYATLFISVIKSSRKVISNENAIPLGKSFYWCLLILCGVRIASFACPTVELWFSSELSHQLIDYSEFYNKAILTLRNIPDTIFLIAFFMLLWNVLVLYHVCHLRVDYHLHEVSVPPLRAFGKSLLSTIIVTAVLAQTIITFLYWFTTIWGPRDYIYINAMTNVCSPIILLVTELYFHIKFSGVPYRSPTSKERLLKVNIILIFWGVCRGLAGGIDFIGDEKEQQIFQGILGSNKNGTALQRLVGPVVFVSQLFFVEILPMLMMTDTKITENFLVKQEIQDGLLFGLPNYSDTVVPISVSENTSIIVGNKRPLSVQEIEISSRRPSHLQSPTLKWINSEDEVSLAEEPFIPRKEGKLGELVKASFRAEPLFARVIKCDKVTRYLVEQLGKELSKVINLGFPFFLRVRGHFDDDYSVTILYEDVGNGSLSDLLSTEPRLKGNLSEELKGNIVRQIAGAVQILHSQQPPCVHGHLISSNILLDKNYGAKLTDFGLPSLKKYANVKIGYTIMDPSIPPEFLSDRPKYVNITEPSADIYAFGFLLWEIFSEEKPFANVGVKELHNLVVTQKSRPKIPDFFGETLSNLIRACWQNDPKKRPSIDRVIDCLNEIDGRFLD